MENTCRSQAQSPLMGLNTNITVDGKELHVQTEDLGHGRHAIVTHVFADGGRVVDHDRFDYVSHLDKANLRERLAKAIEIQHRTMLKKLASENTPAPVANDTVLQKTQEFDAINDSDNTEKVVLTTASPAASTPAASTPAASTPAGALPEEKFQGDTLPYNVTPPAGKKTPSRKMSEDAWIRLCQKAKEEYDHVFASDARLEPTEIKDRVLPEPQDEKGHHPDPSRLGGSLNGTTPKGSTLHGWDAAIIRTKTSVPVEGKIIAPTSKELAQKAFDEGLEKINAKDQRGALIAWSTAVSLDPDDRRFRMNLYRLLGMMHTGKENSREMPFQIAS